MLVVKRKNSTKLGGKPEVNPTFFPPAAPPVPGKVSFAKFSFTPFAPQHTATSGAFTTGHSSGPWLAHRVLTSDSRRRPGGVMVAWLPRLAMRWHDALKMSTPSAFFASDDSMSQSNSAPAMGSSHFISFSTPGRRALQPALQLPWRCATSPLPLHHMFVERRSVHREAQIVCAATSKVA